MHPAKIVVIVLACVFILSLFLFFGFLIWFRFCGGGEFMYAWRERRWLQMLDMADKRRLFDDMDEEQRAMPPPPPYHQPSRRVALNELAPEKAYSISTLETKAAR